MYSTFIVTLFASFLILLAFIFERFGNYWIGAILLSACLLFTYILWALVKKSGVTQINGK